MTWEQIQELSSLLQPSAAEVVLLKGEGDSE